MMEPQSIKNATAAAQEPQKRYKTIRKILLTVLILNLSVSLAKIIYGIISQSLSMQSDGFHSLFDGISNIVGLLGIHIALQPPDKNHQYGHHKFETFSAVFIAMLLIFVAFSIIFQSIRRFGSSLNPQITPLSFIVMLLTMGINIVISWYEQKKGRELDSDVLVADSMHTRSDIYVSLSVIAGLLAVKLGYPIIDPLVALLIAVIITRTAIIIIRESSKALCDETPLDNDNIHDIAKTVPGVQSCHKVRSRGSVGNYYIDLHIRVKPNMSVKEAHRISHLVKDTISDRIAHVKDVVIHIEPES